jgi:hypothetical protein
VVKTPPNDRFWGHYPLSGMIRGIMCPPAELSPRAYVQ